MPLIYLLVTTHEVITPSVIDDPVTGLITVENANIKGVWHYLPTAADNFSQGGGGLYELYDKQTDPSLTLNLIGYQRIPGWGNGTATPIWLGIGGAGTTTFYAAETKPADNATNSFTDLIADNNKSGQLESKTVLVDEAGNVQIDFVFRVKNQTTGKDWYRLAKHWTVDPGGNIHVQATWSILSDGWFSEPAVRFKWRGALWDRWQKYVYDWGKPSTSKYLLGTSGLAKYFPDNITAQDLIVQTFDPLNRCYVDWIGLRGSTTAPPVTVTPLMRFESGALKDHAFEQGVGEKLVGQTIVRQYGTCFMGWWGGNPPKGQRYQFLPAGTTWTDDVGISLAAVTGIGPDIYNVAAETANDGARVSWTTDIASDSELEVKNSTGAVVADVKDPLLTTNHSVPIGGLAPGITYSFSVKSNDLDGNLAVSTAYNFTTLTGPAFTVRVIPQTAYWSTYQDYKNRRLSVSYGLTNDGPATARSATITSAVAINRIYPLSLMPLAVGDVDASTQKTFTIAYYSPQRRTSFSTFLTGYALTPTGGRIDFSG